MRRRRVVSPYPVPRISGQLQKPNLNCMYNARTLFGTARAHTDSPRAGRGPHVPVHTLSHAHTSQVSHHRCPLASHRPAERPESPKPSSRRGAAVAVVLPRAPRRQGSVLLPCPSLPRLSTISKRFFSRFLHIWKQCTTCGRGRRGAGRAEGRGAGTGALGGPRAWEPRWDGAGCARRRSRGVRRHTRCGGLAGARAEERVRLGGAGGGPRCAGCP